MPPHPPKPRFTRLPQGYMLEFFVEPSWSKPPRNATHELLDLLRQVDFAGIEQLSVSWCNSRHWTVGTKRH